MRRKSIFLVGLSVVLLCAGCSPEIDKNKFQNASRAASAIQRSIAAEVTYQDFGELLQRFSDEMTVLEGAVRSKKEKELADEYSALLKMYKDGFLLWKYQREFSGHNFVPRGRIYVGQDLEPIVTKYRLETESHVFGPTRQSWKSISEDSIRIVWYNAGRQLKRIDTLLNQGG
jgi:hypothetical protein